MKQFITTSTPASQVHSATILGVGTHSSYLSTTLDCWTLTFSLECFTKTIISIL